MATSLLSTRAHIPSRSPPWLPAPAVVTVPHQDPGSPLRYRPGLPRSSGYRLPRARPSRSNPPLPAPASAGLTRAPPRRAAGSTVSRSPRAPPCTPVPGSAVHPHTSWATRTLGLPSLVDPRGSPVADRPELPLLPATGSSVALPPGWPVAPPPQAFPMAPSPGVSCPPRSRGPYPLAPRLCGSPALPSVPGSPPVRRPALSQVPGA